MPVHWNPEKIRKSHVIQAARTWREDGHYLNFRDSISYDVIINGKPYPPKAISSIAHKLATGVAILPKEFGGARDGLWHRRLKQLGFEIVEKGSDASLSYDVAKSFKLSRKTRLAKIAAEAKTPLAQLKVEVTRFIRSPHVVAERLFISQGHCEECKKPAPFRRLVDNSPFLEVHHVEPLSNGGLDIVENTQALCPNCHSEIHDRLRIERQVE
jgi:hypothetical protein